MELATALRRLAGSPQKASRLLEMAAAETGVEPDFASEPLLAMALCIGGRRPDEVSASLGWREFEVFCARMLKAGGYAVKENLVLTKPRVQIDILASGPSFVLSIDCKHWKRDHGLSALRRIAAAQKRRSKILRARQPGAKPIISVILSFSAPEGTFVEGVPLVPVRTLRSFLDSVESYSDHLDFQ